MDTPLRLYHFTTATFGLDDIVKQRLKIALINELNDPFELVGCDLNDKHWRKSFRQYKAEMHEKFGMVCFSRNWEDPVQWGHYADRHRGVCLGFDVNPIHAKQVSYVRSRVPIPYEEDLAISTSGQKNTNLEAFFGPLLYTKFAHWSYEDEFRMWSALNEFEVGPNGQKLYFMNFDQGLALREVIVGSESTLTRDDVTKALSAFKGVEVSKARPAFRSFKIVKQKNPRLWK